MGHQSQVKAFRKQIKNVITADHLGEALATEAFVSSAKILNEIIIEKLDEVGKKVEERMDLLDKQTQTFRGYAIRELGSQLQNELFELNLNLLAHQAVLTKSLGIADLPAFAEAVKAEKEEIRVRLVNEAEAKNRAEEALATETAAKDKAAKEFEKTGSLFMIEPLKTSDWKATTYDATAAPTPATIDAIVKAATEEPS